MKQMKLFAAMLIVAAAALTGCKAKPINVDSSAAYATFQTSCLHVDGDGTETLRAFGKGRDKGDAIEQAKRNAVISVIFDGITDGTVGCNQRPVLTEVNARERYETYFNAFFKNGGAYNKYVKADPKEASRIKAKATAQEQWGVVVTVDRPGLRQRLINDGILKP